MRQPRAPEDWVMRTPPLEQSDQPVITWIGHATALIQVGGGEYYHGPYFLESVAPFQADATIGYSIASDA